MSDKQMARVIGQSGSSVCILPRSLLTHAGWRAGEIINISFGSANRKVRVQGGDNENWYFPVALLRSLGLAPRRWCYQIDRERKQIKFGPLIGILTTWHVTPYFRSLMRAAARNGMMAVILRPNSLRPGTRQMTAWGLVNGTVNRITLPWPDVVYNRIPNRGGELLASTRICRRLLGRAGIPVFNNKFFHKWRIHRLLRKDEQVKQYLPATQPISNMQQVGHFLQRYPAVYLKPNGGSKGQGIVKVSRLRGQGYLVSYRRGRYNSQQTYSNWSSAAAVSRRAMHRRSYLVQEGVPLATYHGRPFDVRVTLYKDAKRQWIPCGPAAKVAGRGSITTHVANGGRVIPLKRALQHVFGKQAPEIHSRIESATIELSKAIERVTELELGEIGIDIGLTADGRIAMFEANSKPGRAIFSPPWNRHDRWKSLILLCDYAATLAGFNKEVS